MKPWERDWEFQSGCWPEVVFYKGGNKKVCDVWADEDSSTCDVADLIAAAPKMARCLIEAGGLLEEYLQAWEGAPEPSELKTKDVAARILAVLRAAGVET